MRMISILNKAFMGFALAVGLSGAALAQSAPANGTVFGDWRLACQATAINETACSIAQTLTTNDNNMFLAEVTLQNALIEEATRTILALSTPINMILTAQPGYRVGATGDTLPLIWRTCSPQFCTASRVLDPDELAALRAGLKMTVGYHPVGRPEPIVFEVSLKGVSAGMNALSQ